MNVQFDPYTFSEELKKMRNQTFKNNSKAINSVILAPDQPWNSSLDPAKIEEIKITKATKTIKILKDHNNLKISNPFVQVNVGKMSIKGKSQPNRAEKINQDSILVELDFDSVSHQGVFGVFDGHGGEGHLVSQYAVKNLTERVRAEIKGNMKSSCEVLRII